MRKILLSFLVLSITACATTHRQMSAKEEHQVGKFISTSNTCTSQGDFINSTLLAESHKATAYILSRYNYNKENVDKAIEQWKDLELYAMECRKVMQEAQGAIKAAKRGRELEGNSLNMIADSAELMMSIQSLTDTLKKY